MEWWHLFKEWFFSLGEKYNVNPYIFGGIYVGAIPFFFISLYRTIKISGIKSHLFFPLCLQDCFLFPLIYILLLSEEISRCGCTFLLHCW
ncbi:MAG TPA: hypothetical protein VMU83_10985 [Hanamia sp.]|nr:hypothetical protein [Hanamia sp.]